MKKILPAIAVALLGTSVVWFWARPAYKRHKETRFLERALSFQANGDYANASLSARQTLQANPRNLEPCRIMAELSELSRSPHALDWRRRIAELDPTIQNKLAVAATALRTQPPRYSSAAQTLEELRPAANEVAAYHAISAELALKLKNPSQA